MFHKEQLCKIISLSIFILSISACVVQNEVSTTDEFDVPLKEAMTLEYLESLIPYQEGKAIKEGQKVKGSLDGAINLEQGWTEASQQEFYFTTQGSQILPYKWFLHLEQANNNSLFRSNKNIRRFAYIPSGKTKRNPDGLSVGFARHIDKNNNVSKDWVGLTCAACHTGEVVYKGTTIRIDGAPTMADFETFNDDLVAALKNTYYEKSKFERFAKNVLGKKYTIEMAKLLHSQLDQQMQVLDNRNKINHPTPSQPRYGYARIDAIGAIFNQVMSVFNENPLDARASNAPVSYPFVWGTHQSNVVQWTGFAPNGPLSLGALIRNGGEVLGVYGKIDIGNRHSTAYPSSLDFHGLGTLEARVAQLKAPPWPEKLPSIDEKKAIAGEKIYREKCHECHKIVARKNQGQPYKATLTPISEVQTDAQEILNLNTNRNAGKYAGRKELVQFGSEIGYLTSGLDPLVNSVVGSIIDQKKSAIAAAFTQYQGGLLANTPGNGINVSPEDKKKRRDKILKHYQDLKFAYGVISRCMRSPRLRKVCSKLMRGSEDLLKDGIEITSLFKKIEANIKEVDGDEDASEKSMGQVYKGRPLNGIWATAPYLHNGSVPNMMQLLLPAKDRISKFYVGSREFDPEKMGFDSQQTSRSTLYDTSLLGNSNSGHEYGIDLSEKSKMQLLEYMKSL